MTWLSLLVNVMINGGTGPHVDLPLLAFLVPAVLAVLAGAIITNRELVWWRHVAGIALVAIIGVPVTAGLVSQLSGHSGSWLAVATHPWTLTGHATAITAAASWLVAAVAWGRGLWQALDPPSFRAAIWSIGLAATAFVGIFAGRSRSHASEFLAASSNAGWLLFLWFPFVTAAAALVRQRELEREVLNRTRSRPSRVWFAILVVPMFGVALLALLIAVAIGPAAPAVGHGIARAAIATGDGIAAAARWLWGLLPGISGGNSGRAHPLPPTGQQPVPPVRPAGHLGSLPVAAQIAILVVAGLIVLGGIVWALRHLPERVPRPAKVADIAIEEERDSLFTWRHLGGQLWASIVALLRRLLGRRRHGHHPDPVVGSAPARGRTEAETIRQAYRRVLRAARAAGHARAPSETTRELQARLRALDPVPAGPLGQLTDLYDRVRYGEADPADLDAAAAVPVAVAATAHADAITLGLTR